MRMILTEQGKLKRGKHRGRFVRELTDAELRGCVGGFNRSAHATRLDREVLAAELQRRTLPVPPGFIEGRRVRRRNDNGISPTQNGVANGTPAPEDHKHGEAETTNNNGHVVASKSRMNGKAKRQNDCQPADFIGEIDVNGVYTSEAFRARLRSGRGPMAADTLTTWIDRGLRVGHLPDGRLMIRGRWVLEWIERGCCPEPDSNDEENGQWVRSMDEHFACLAERRRLRRERCNTKVGG